MANSFSKQETVMFDEVFEKFEDQCVASKLFGTFNVADATAERSGDTVWRLMPYVALSYTGLDQTANFNRNYAQLSVPTTIGYSHSTPLTLTAKELRDASQQKNLGKAAMQRLASDINIDCSNLAALTGSVVIKRTTAAAGFDDIAQIDETFNRLGIPMGERKAMLSSRDYNGMAKDIAARGTMNDKVSNAYEKAYVGEVASFDTYKLDYAYRLNAATATGVTINGANQYYTPKATSTAATGESSNVDNRYQTIAVTVGGSTVKVGDAFTIAGVNEVHHITKLDTGSPKTFRVTAIVTGAGGTGTIQITPPIISGTGGTDAELQYKNVTAVPANTAAITFLNTASGFANPFWQGDCFEIIPGHYVPAPDSGLAQMSSTTENGVQVLMTRQGDINNLNTKYRWDVFYGLVNKNPQMSGIELFSQT